MKTLEGKKILVIDDEPLLLEIFRDELKALGAQVITASDGFEAFEIIQKTTGLAAIVTDEMMPKMSGIQLIQKISSTPAPHPPIFLCSGALGILERVKHLQICRVFRKPLDWEDAISTIVHELS